MSNNEIMKKLESYQELKRLKEELEAEMKMIQQELINEMETRMPNKCFMDCRIRTKTAVKRAKK